MALTEIPVIGAVFLPDNVTPCTGSAVFTPGDGLLVDAVDGRILAGELTVDLADGLVTTRLPPTDTPGTQPEPGTWNWTVRFKLNEATIPPFSFAVPSDADSIDLSKVARVAPAPGTYIVVPGPAGPQGPKGDKGDTGTGGGAVDSVNGETGAVIMTAAKVGADPAGAAATAQTAATTTAAADATAKVSAHAAAADPHGDRAAAAADATSKASAAQAAATTTAAADATAKVSAHAAAADPHGDRAWASGQFDPHGAADAAQAAAELHADNAIAGEANRADAAYDPAGTATTAAAGALASAKTYADTGDTTTLNAAKAYTDSHSSGGGTGTAIVTPTDDRIDLEIVVLTNAGTWTVVRTSGGTAIGKSVKAAAGDRVWVSPSFMYTGNQYYLDMAVMKADGTTISRFASSSGTSAAAGPEGYAPDYTQAASFPHVSGVAQFTVAADEIDAGGNFTVNLAYIAPSLSGTDQKVYFGSGYLGRWLMANIGPAPA